MAQLLVEGTPVCRACDLPFSEESDSPNPANYRLFKCPNCGARIGMVAKTGEFIHTDDALDFVAETYSLYGA